MRRIQLQNEQTPRCSRTVTAELTEAGDLKIDGRELGPCVADFFGAGASEYEWIYTISGEHLSDVVDALGGVPGTDVLVMLQRYFMEVGPLTNQKLDQHGIPYEFWNRIGPEAEGVDPAKSEPTEDAEDADASEVEEVEPVVAGDGPAPRRPGEG